MTEMAGSAVTEEWVLSVAHDLKRHLEVKVGAILMTPVYNGGLAYTQWAEPWTRVPDLMAFSLPFWRANYGNDDLLTDIVLHEMAHAMLLSHEGHSARWAVLAQGLGGTGEEFCSQPRNEPTGLRYVGVCTNCDWTTSQTERRGHPNQGWVCPACAGVYYVLDTAAIPTSGMCNSYTITPEWESFNAH